MCLQIKCLLATSTSDGLIIPALLKLSVAKDTFANTIKMNSWGKMIWETNCFLKKNFFWCGPFLKSLFELLLFYVLVFWPQGMWILAPQPRIKPAPSANGRRSLNPWITREVKSKPNFFSLFPKFLSWYADIKLHLNKYHQNK